jgi:hippurate hydrolase
VHFIFQPAEENEGGGRVMVEQGLFRDFPCERVYGMHNWPGLDVGRFAVRPGPVMAAFDVFEIVVRGRGAHAAKPQQGVDPVVAAAHVVSALQTVVSRTVDPLDAAVVSVTQIHAGDAWNVIPESAVLRGTARSFRSEVRDALEGGIRRVAQGTARALGAEVEIRYERRYPPTVNDPAAVEECAAAAADVVGAANVERNPSPSMGAEDFSFMLQQKPGCYIWAGNGPTDGERFLHNPHYDFNDALLPIGAAYWVRLVERVLA